MKILSITFIFLLALQATGHESSTPAYCNGISGLQVVTDYKSDGTPFTRKTKTELYTSYDDDAYFNYLMVDSKVFKSDFEISIEILNMLKNPIQKFVFNKWTQDKDFPNQKITKTTLSKFIELKLNQPFDKYLNLPKAERKDFDLKKLPFSARFSIGSKNKKPLCVFDFTYGDLDSED